MGIFKKAVDSGFQSAKAFLGGIYEGDDFEKLEEAMSWRRDTVANALYRFAEQLIWLRHHYPERAKVWDRFWDNTLLEFGEMSFPIFPYSR